jgi:hypothetical protein
MGDTKVPNDSLPLDIDSNSISIGTEDIIAIFAGIIALAFAIAIIFGKLPDNTLNIGVVVFSASGAAIAKIIKAKK